MNDTKAADRKKKVDMRSYMMIIALIAIWIIFAITTEGVFITGRNISNLLTQMAGVTILGAGMVFVLLTGKIDLSVGALVTLTGVVAAVLMAWNGWATIPTILVVLAMGLGVGLLNGFITVYLKVPAFITTLGMQMVFQGVVIGIGKGVSIAPMADIYKQIGNGYIDTPIVIVLGAVCFLAYLTLTMSKRSRRRAAGLEMEKQGSMLGKMVLVAVGIAVFVWVLSLYKGLPIAVLLMIVLVVVLRFFAEKTKTGRYIYAVGGNEQAAYCAGINVNKTNMITFVICSMMAVVAGIVITSRLNCGSATSGDMKELDAIAAAVIGGCSLSGGKGRVVGAILGAIIMASLDNGMSMLGIEAFWQYMVKGAILIIAVALDATSQKAK